MRGPYQRRRRHRQRLVIHKVTRQVDSRGNTHYVIDPEAEPIVTTGWVIPQRSARAEVAGQQSINVVRIGVTHDLSDVNLWSQVDWNGSRWDVVTPPAYRHGTPHVRHWSIDLRERPS